MINLEISLIFFKKLRLIKKGERNRVHKYLAKVVAHQDEQYIRNMYSNGPITTFLCIFSPVKPWVKKFWNRTVGCTVPSISHGTSKANAIEKTNLTMLSTTPITNGCQFFSFVKHFSSTCPESFGSCQKEVLKLQHLYILKQ